jgi:hypothetical protein
MKNTNKHKYHPILLLLRLPAEEMQEKIWKFETWKLVRGRRSDVTDSMFKPEIIKSKL